MKQTVSAPLLAFLTSTPQPDKYLIVECLTLTLPTGTVFRFATSDRDMVLGANTFLSFSARVKRDKITSRVGVEDSQCKVTIAPAASSNDVDGQIPAGGVAGSLLQLAMQGQLAGTKVRIEQVFQPITLASGKYSDNSWGSLIVFIGMVADTSIDRSAVELNVVSDLHQLLPMWPSRLIQPSCGWRLFDGGCRLTRATFAIAGTAQSGSSAASIQHLLNNVTNPATSLTVSVLGYLNGGVIEFTAGALTGLRRQIKVATAQGFTNNYPNVVLNDKPILYYKFNDAALSTTVADSSGNGYNGTVHGTVTFQQTSLVPTGDPSGKACKFDGSTGYVTAPVPKPPTAKRGVTFEFVYTLNAGAGAGQPVGIFDTKPGVGVRGSGANYTAFLGVANGGEPADTQPGFEWWRDKPYIAFTPSAPGTPQHIVLVVRGQNVMDLYINGILWDTQMRKGGGVIDWNNPITIGRLDGGASGWFNGILQHFAIFNYPFSPNQVAGHYASAIATPSTNGNGTLFLLAPFPAAPSAGDAFNVFPGCDHSQRTCDITFANLTNHGGFEFVPIPEQGL